MEQRFSLTLLFVLLAHVGLGSTPDSLAHNNKPDSAVTPTQSRRIPVNYDHLGLYAEMGEHWARYYNRTAQVTKRQLVSYQIASPGAPGESDTTWFYLLIGGGEKLSYDYVLNDCIIPLGLIMPYVTASEEATRAMERGTMAVIDPKISDYFPPFTSGPYAGQYPTWEQIQRSRCYHEYQYQLQLMSQPKQANAAAIVYPVVQIVGTLTVTYLVLNTISFDHPFLEGEVEFLQAQFWAQAGEAVSRGWEDFTIAVSTWWAEEHAATYTMGDVTIAWGGFEEYYWLSAQATRMASRDATSNEASQRISDRFSDIENLFEPGGGNKPPRDPGEIKKWLFRGLAFLTTAGTGADVVMREGNPIHQSCIRMYDGLHYSQDPQLGELAVLMHQLLNPDYNVSELTHALGNQYYGLVHNALEALSDLEADLGEYENPGEVPDNLSFFADWARRWDTVSVVPTRAEVLRFMTTLRSKIAADTDAVQYYLDDTDARLQKFWRFVCDNQERPIPSGGPWFDITRPQRVLISRDMQQGLNEALDAFRENGRVLSDVGGTGLIWECDEYPEIVIKVVTDPMGTTDEEIEREFLYQESIGRLIKDTLGYPTIRTPKPYLAFYDASGDLCIVMEKVNGYSLSQLLTHEALRSQYPSLANRSRITRLEDDFGEMIRAMHAYGWAHGDLTGNNVMVDLITGQLVLIDFGASRHRRDEGFTRASEYDLGRIGVITDSLEAIWEALQQ